VPGYDVQIIDNLGKNLNPGEEGLVVIKLPLPPGTLPSLWNADERFIESYMKIFPGYYFTSDGGYIVFVDTDTQIPPDPNNFGFLKLGPDPVSRLKYDNQIYPQKFGLLNIYPNPFNPLTKIDYSLTTSGEVILNIYDVLGKLISTPVKKLQHPGIYQVNFYADNLPSGIYLIQLHQGSYIDVSKIVLIK